MKKFLFILFGLFVVAGAFAAGENVPTSKGYVDSKLGEKQDIIPANDGTAQVLTNTGTAGEYGTKGIYDANGAYATQTQNLVDAATMNAGVQNAINSEFQCIEWANPNDHSSDCLLFNIFGETGKFVLPTGFTALEYIESTGTQYIDTGIWIQKDTTAKLDMSAELLPTGWFGANAFLQLYITSTHYAILSGSNPSVKIIPGNRDTIILDYDSNKVLNLYINGNFIQKTSWNTLTSTQSKFYVFALGNYDGNVFTGGSRSIKGKVYSIKLSVNNTLVRNFIPAQRDSDGEIGMYDTVTNSFFTNSGTGEFIAGPVVNLYLPSGN